MLMNAQTTHRVSSRRPGYRLLARATGMAIACLALCGVGCSVFRSEPGGVLTATSTDGTKSLAPDFKTAAYTSTDGDTADVYLSDLPRERFTNPRDNLSDCTGSILHLHIFLVPEAGQTPIDNTACNITVRQLVLTKNAPHGMGLYGGGGFLLPRGEFGSGDIGGSINAASHRLTRFSTGFNDLLGPGTLTGGFSAPLDEQLAQQMSAKLETLIGTLPALTTEDADLKSAPTKKPADTKGKEKKPAK
jgi:hypothetical protein